MNGTDKAEEIAAIADDYDAALKRMRYGEEPEADPYDPFADLAAIETLAARLRSHLEKTA